MFLYSQIVSENRQQLYWFGPAVEVPLILFYVLIVVFGLFANGLICYTGTPRVLNTYLSTSAPLEIYVSRVFHQNSSVADPGGAEGAMPPPLGPLKISHKKDGHQRWSYRFHVSRPPLTQRLDPLLELVTSDISFNSGSP